MKKLLSQIIRFCGVGALCFIIDFSVLLFLHNLLSVNILISAAAAFTVSVAVNYILSVKFVFNTSAEKTEMKKFILFTAFSIAGLIITELLMHTGVNVLNINYIMVKSGATAVVMVFNFVTRKIFLEK